MEIFNKKEEKISNLRLDLYMDFEEIIEYLQSLKLKNNVNNKINTNDIENAIEFCIKNTNKSIQTEKDFGTLIYYINTIFEKITATQTLDLHKHLHQKDNFQIHAHIFENGKKTTIKITIDPKTKIVYAEEHGGDIEKKINEITTNNKKKQIIKAAKNIFNKKIKSLPHYMFATPKKNAIPLGKI